MNEDNALDGILLLENIEMVEEDTDQYGFRLPKSLFINY